MACIDPTVSQKLLDRCQGPAWEEHIRRCASCRKLQLMVGSGALWDEVEVHPAPKALHTLRTAPNTLSPGTRTWLEAHLEHCPTCRALDPDTPPTGNV